MDEKEAEKTLSSPDLAVVAKEILRTVESLEDVESGGKVVLVIDQMDLLLAAGGDQIGVVNLHEMLMGLREVSCFPNALSRRSGFKYYLDGACNNIVYSGGLSTDNCSSDAVRDGSHCIFTKHRT